MRPSARRHVLSARAWEAERSVPTRVGQAPPWTPQSRASPVRTRRARRPVRPIGILKSYATGGPAWIRRSLPWFEARRCGFSVKYDVGPGTHANLSKAAVFVGNEYLAFARVIGLPDNAFEFHSLHQRGRAVITDLQPALNVAGGRLAVAFDDRNRLREQIAAAVNSHAGSIEHRAVFLARLFRGNGFEIFGRALRLEVPYHFFDLLVGDEGAMHAADAPAARHIKHVALSEQLLGAHFTQNGAAVDLGSDLE